MDTLYKQNTVRIPKDRVLFNHVPRGVGRDDSNAEVVPLRLDSISTEPVPTEPVAASAAGQSYAAAGTDGVAVPHGDVVVQLVLGAGGPSHEDPRCAIGRDCNADNPVARGVVENDALVAKLLNQTGAVNADIGLPVDGNPKFAGRCATGASRLRIGLPRHGEAVQLQRYIRRTDDDTCGACDGASDVVHQLAILSDGECTGNGPADIYSVGATRQHNERTEQCGKPRNPPQT